MAQHSKILVTGGCGYIGSHVVRRLSEAGKKVVVIDDLSTGFRDALLHGEELVEGSFGDEAILRKVFEKHSFDAALHFAASAALPESLADPLKYYENNVANTVHLLKALQRGNVSRLVFSSTGSLYGDEAPTPTPETFEPKPSNPYSRSKRVCEWMVEDLSRASGIRHVILRYFNVAGADPKGRNGQRTAQATHLVKIAAELATGKRNEIAITGTDFDTPDGTGIRDYIHVEDLASAHVDALNYLERGGASTTLNAGYGHGFSVREVLAALGRVMGKTFPAKEAPRRPGDIASSVADSRKIRETLGWKPQFDDIEEILRTAIAFEKQLK